MGRKRKPNKPRRLLEKQRQRLEDRIVGLEQAVAGSSASASALADLAVARAELAEVIRGLRRLDRAGEHDPNLVEMGDTVTVRVEGSSETERFTIVGPVEAGVDDSWISAESPIGSALLGRSRGDTATVEAPGGRVRYKVLSVERS
jgi:transcription elongation factor GreA